MANKYRGEVECTIGDETYTLRPTFNACVEFEDEAGITMFEALQGGERASIKLRTVVSAIWAGIRGANPGKEKECPSFQEVGEMVHAHGISKLLPTVFQFLTYGLAGDQALKDQPSGKVSTPDPETKS